MFSTDAEFNGLSSVIYRNEILQSHLKILAKIQLSVICTHIPYKANHSTGKTFAVFAVDQATAKVFPQTKYSPVIGVHTS